MFVASELSAIIQPYEQLISYRDLLVRQIVIDSRQIIHGGEALFVAIEGKRTDGHKFIQEAHGLGVRNFVLKRSFVRATGFDTGSLVESNLFIVDDTIHALQSLAIAHRNKYDIPCIGITGSNGKTWVKEWLFQLLLADYHIVKSPRSYNSQIGVPLSVLLTDDEHDLAIFEAGISQTGEMDRLAEVIQPTIGILTHLGDAHDAGFEGREEKLREKCLLFADAQVVIYPASDDFISERIAELCPNGLLLSWGEKEGASLRVTEISRRDHAHVEYVYDGKRHVLDIPYSDHASIENALMSCLLLHYLQVPQMEIARRILQLQNVTMRLEMHRLDRNCLLIDDSYSLDLESLKIGLETMQQHGHGRVKALIISDIEKEHTDDYHKIAALVNSHAVDIIYGVGDQIQSISGLINANSRLIHYPAVEDFINSHIWETSDNTVFLLKGARRFAFEKIVRAMRSRSHSAVLEIDLNAMLDNLQYFASKLDPGTQIIAMVKASAYGSGSVEVGKFLEHNNVDRLCVAYADEGVELRKAGVSLPIMVLNPDPGNLDKLIDYRLEPEVYSVEFLNLLSQVLSRSQSTGEGKFRAPNSKSQIPSSESLGGNPVSRTARHGSQPGVHIKIDTGMHRLGIDVDQMGALIKTLAELPQIHVESVFTHLAAADDPKEDAFTRAQIGLFEQCHARISAALGYAPMRHVLNTYGILRFPEFQFDAVRVGIGLYGVGIHIQHQLRPVHIMKARVSQVRKVAKGETVGYGRAFKANRDSVIATVNAGYADGIPRQAGGGEYTMFVRGAHARIAGRVCMDMCMLDVTDIQGVEQGDIVEVFGSHASIETLARDCRTIPYEILTGISERIPRVFKFE